MSLVRFEARIVACVRSADREESGDQALREYQYPWHLSVGDNSWIGEEVWIDNLADVEIGRNCCVSQGAMLLCGNHDYTKASFDLKTGTIVLKDGAWVGAKAMGVPA